MPLVDAYQEMIKENGQQQFYRVTEEGKQELIPEEEIHKSIDEMNAERRDTIRDFKRKSFESEREAAKFIINT